MEFVSQSSDCTVALGLNGPRKDYKIILVTPANSNKTSWSRISIGKNLQLVHGQLKLKTTFSILDPSNVAQNKWLWFNVISVATIMPAPSPKCMQTKF